VLPLAQETKLGFSVNGDSIIATIGSCSVMMSRIVYPMVTLL